jgi:hypothetical protein
MDIRQITTTLEDVIQTTCREMYSFKEILKPRTKERTVSLWTDKLLVKNEKDKRPEKAVSTDNNQRNSKGKQEETIQSEGGISNSNKNLYTDTGKQPME